ncbi:MAG: Methyltransferase domain [Ilumatobacteraceae bacterium]|nr:Methyltransferase domain [Ilumatobacteraceae bacterium]
MDGSYAQRLQRLSRRGGALRKLIDPQRPYRWNLRRMQPGFVLDIGCGIGRNLAHLDGAGVGIDHNVDCIAACRADGLTAYVTDEFAASPDAVPGRFDSLLISHVLEHMTDDDAVALVHDYLPYLRPGGRVIIITPQERGQASDETHVMFVDEPAVRRLADRLHLQPTSIRSFPFPRWMGRAFTYNETVSVLS